jgi:hypothetical protein
MTSPPDRKSYFKKEIYDAYWQYEQGHPLRLTNRLRRAWAALQAYDSLYDSQTKPSLKSKLARIALVGSEELVRSRHYPPQDALVSATGFDRSHISSAWPKN